MKKAIALILALILCLSLVACGGGNNEATETNSPKTSGNEIALNEAVNYNDIQFTLTEIGDFVENYTMNSNSRYEGSRKDGYSFVKVSYTLKNIGKNEIDNYCPVRLTMNYADGYEFTADKMWYFSPETYSSTSGQRGVWVNSCPAFSPFDDAIECVAVFQLPNEVNESSEPWSITISLGEEFQYTIR